jgi:exonuclease III
MYRVIFWNVNKKDLRGHVCSIAATTNADAIVLNENSVKAAGTLAALQSRVSKSFSYPKVISDKRFQCFCRTQSMDLSEVHSGNRLSVRRMIIDSRTCLLALFHGVDMRNYDTSERQSFAQCASDELRMVTDGQGTKHLVILGDFNMNPYDTGMGLAAGFNAMMTKACTAPGQRTHNGKCYEYFYNPMWSLFGDNTPGPPGTVHDTSSQGPYGWSMLDQVLLHHTMIDRFHNVQILTHAGTTPLTNPNGRPDASAASDHLPILVDLKGDRDD